MILLYKAGDQHEVRGVKCDLKRFHHREFKDALAAGWHTSPHDVYKKKPEVIEPEVNFEDVDLNKSGKLSSSEVRAAAKEHGIEGYDKKRISTLKKELGLDG